MIGCALAARAAQELQAGSAIQSTTLTRLLRDLDDPAVGGFGPRTVVKGFLQTLLFAEIKRHDTELLMATPYRAPDVYQVSREVSGAVSQVQKTAHEAVKKLGDLHRQSDPSGRYQFDVSTIRPRQVVVVGQLTQLADGNAINVEKMSSFELWRTGQLGTEILTFDELYERAKYIVETQEGGPTPTRS